VAKKKNKSDNPLQFDRQVCFKLYAAHRAVSRVYTSILEPLGLTYLQYLVMLIMWEDQSISVKRLGERLRLDSGTLTPLLKKMEEKGLISRRRSDLDERSVDITLTGEGRKLKEHAFGIPKKLTCKITINLEEIKKLQTILDKILVLTKVD